MSGIRPGVPWVVLAAMAFAIPPQVSAPQAALTPGTVALLIMHSDPAATSLLQRALLDPDPVVRRVAARVVASGHRELLTPLIGALAREQDSHVAAEMIADVLAAGGAPAVSLVEPQVRRLGGVGVLPLAEWLARMQPDRFIQSLPELAPVAADAAPALADLVALAAAQHPTQRDRLLLAWMPLAPDRAWRRVLDDAFPPAAGYAGAQAVFGPALASDRPSVRAETVWFLVAELSSETDVPRAILDDAMPTREGGAETWEALGRELIARRRKKIPTTDRSALLAQNLPEHPEERFLDRFPDLTPAERHAVKTGAGVSDEFDFGLAEPGEAQVLPTIVPGLLGSLMQAADCTTTANHDAGYFRSSYAENGATVRAELDASALPSSCHVVIDTLARLTRATPAMPVVDASQQWTVVPMDAEWVACESEPIPDPEDRSFVAKRIGGLIPVPSKIKDRRPAYPPDMERQRIQGVVIVAATISPSGCVSAARILRRILPPLDMAALRAVADWRYSPTSLNGKAVPVMLTAIVNFVLR
ncbi:MAG TPA: energy transducer TonB [Vicinamibacterales bacterium]|nr:energy transducer TonB [Vicinamibacterales bacterium]